jgi:hypothetical protein
MFRSALVALDVVKDPTVSSWLRALGDARLRTISTLKGINPRDAVQEMLRDKHQLLVGEPTAEKVYTDLSFGEFQSLIVQGRKLDTGLPGQVEVSRAEVQAADKSQAAMMYIHWAATEGGQTIAKLLYAIAANEANWLYVGVLKQPMPDEISAFFRRDPDEMNTLIRGETLAQHWRRLEIVRSHLYATYSKMKLKEFQKERQGSPRLLSAEWVIHELCQFEAERRNEIASLYAAAQKALGDKSDHF